MSEAGQERFIKEVVASTIGHCSACQHPYDAGSVSVLGHQEELWFLAVVCDQCQARGLVAALVKEQSLQSTSQSTTQTSDGLPGASSTTRAIVGPVVSPDDVLTMHEFLTGFDGDFKALFSPSG